MANMDRSVDVVADADMDVDVDTDWSIFYIRKTSSMLYLMPK